MPPTKDRRKIEVRPAGVKDTPGIVELWHALMTYHRPFDPRFRPRRNANAIMSRFVRQAIGKPRTYAIRLAEVDGKLAAYTFATVTSKTAPPLNPLKRGVIMDMFVSPSYRRMGIGKKLFLDLKKWFRQRRVPRMEVSHMCVNRRADVFWRRMGFRPLREAGVQPLRRR